MGDSVQLEVQSLDRSDYRSSRTGPIITTMAGGGPNDVEKLATPDIGSPETLDSPIWSWGDDVTSVGFVSEEGLLTGSHIYQTPSVYTLHLDLPENGQEAGSTNYTWSSLIRTVAL